MQPHPIICRGRLFVSCLLMLVVAFAVTSFAQSLEQKYDEYLTAAEKVLKFRGAALVAKDGRIIFAKGYGMADEEAKLPNTPETKYLMGSITKQFTATAILQLAEEKLLDVNDPIGKYLADYPKPNADKITIHHLLNHTSGIPSYTGLPAFNAQRYEAWTPAKLVALFKDLPLEFEPGAEWRYSNSNYFLLGLIVEHVAGISYDAYLQEHIFGPLGMKNSGYPTGHMEILGLAKGYTTDSADAITPARMVHSSTPYAAGALYATVGDMVLWDKGLRDGSLLSQESLDKMFTPYKQRYGYGWMIDSLHGHRMVTHNGGIDGFVSTFIRFLDEQFCTVVFCNNESASVDQAGFDLVAITYGKPYDVPAMKIPAEINPAVLDDYVGVYEISPNTYRMITREGDSLFAMRTGGNQSLLRPEGKDKFYYDYSNAITLVFVRDAGGRIVEHIIHQRGSDSKAVRLDDDKAKPILEAAQPAAVDPAVFVAYVGEYELAPGFILTVNVRDNRIFTQATGQPEVEIYPHSETEYFLKVVDAQISFVKDSAGAVTDLVLHQGGQNMPAKKIK